MARHRCKDRTQLFDPFALCRHRFVWGDLLPMEAYTNGNTGRHHSPDDVPDTTEAPHI
jgi:hypothetical protein